MLLYTIIPLESVFKEEGEEIFPEVELREENVSLLCQSTPSGEMKISRLISSNPQDYLNPKWQPGAIIRKH